MKKIDHSKVFNSSIHLFIPFKSALLPITVVGFLGLCFGGALEPAYGDETLDARYRVQTVLPLILNKQAHPVYSNFIEKNIHKSFEKFSAWKVPSKKLTSQNLVDETLKKFTAIEEPFAEHIGFLGSLNESLYTENVDAVLVLQIQEINEKTKNLQAVLVNTFKNEFLLSSSSKIENLYSLKSLESSMHSVVESLQSRIPFDATVIKRTGYTVVIDRGNPDFKLGQKIATYTLEDEQGDPVLVESGQIEITEVGNSLSFGKVLLEKHPQVVAQNNKIKIAHLHKSEEGLLFNKPSRMPSSLLGATMYNRGKLGYADLQLGATAVSASQLSATGQGAESSSIFPGGKLLVEMWLTQSAFFDFGFQFGVLGGLNGSSSSMNDLRLRAGYRLALETQDPQSPSLNLTAGFISHKLSVDPSTALNSFVTTAFSGLIFGGGAMLPVTPRWGVGFDINGIIFGSVSEDPLVSGNPTGISGWDFALKGYYRWRPETDLSLKFSVLSYKAEFDGRGNRPVRIVSSSQTAKSLMLGLNYYF